MNLNSGGTLTSFLEHSVSSQDMLTQPQKAHLFSRMHSLQPFSFNDSSEYTLQSSGTVTPTFPLLRDSRLDVESLWESLFSAYFSQRIS